MLQKISMNSRSYFLGLLTAFLAVSLGCQSNMTYKRLAAKNPMSKNSAKMPNQMVDVWNNYAQTTPEGQVVRGIAGRIHFYDDARKKRAVKVDGDLTVFLFDGKETDPTRSKPLRVYKFPAETMDSHHAFKKPLGHGYDFFLPFDEINGEEKNLCIMARFDDRLESNLVVTKPVHTILKGSKKATPETSFQQFLANNSILGKTGRDAETKGDQGIADQSSGESNEIRQVVFNETEKDQKINTETETVQGREKPQRNVTTISLNDNMSRRLALSTESGKTANSTETVVKH